MNKPASKPQSGLSYKDTHGHRTKSVWKWWVRSKTELRVKKCIDICGGTQAHYGYL